MNEETEKQILAELQTLSGLARREQSFNRKFAAMGGLLLVCAAALLVGKPFVEDRRDSTPPAPIDSWDGVRTLIDRDDLPKARAMLTRLMGKYPNYHYGYALMATTYMVEGNFKEAEQNDAKAFELFPSEGNEKVLTAARKALERQASANRTDKH